MPLHHTLRLHLHAAIRAADIEYLLEQAGVGGKAAPG